MKETYEKPQIFTNGQVEGVVPAAVAAALSAVVAGVGMGTQIRQMLNDGRFLRSFIALQEHTVAEAPA